MRVPGFVFSSTMRPRAMVSLGVGPRYGWSLQRWKCARTVSPPLASTSWTVRGWGWGWQRVLRLGTNAIRILYSHIWSERMGLGRIASRSQDGISWCFEPLCQAAAAATAPSTYSTVVATPARLLTCWPTAPQEPPLRAPASIACGASGGCLRAEAACGRRRLVTCAKGSANVCNGSYPFAATVRSARVRVQSGAKACAVAERARSAPIPRWWLPLEALRVIAYLSCSRNRRGTL